MLNRVLKSFNSFYILKIKSNQKRKSWQPIFQADAVDPLSKLPLGLRLRAKQVFTSVLKYAFELLTLDTMMKVCEIHADADADANADANATW